MFKVCRLGSGVQGLGLLGFSKNWEGLVDPREIHGNILGSMLRGTLRPSRLQAPTLPQTLGHIKPAGPQKKGSRLRAKRDTNLLARFYRSMK